MGKRLTQFHYVDIGAQRYIWCLEWKARDLWIGAYWEGQGSWIEVWICVVPMLPIHIYGIKKH